MVSVSTMLAGLSAIAATNSVALTAAANSIHDLPTFDIPAFDYATLTQGDAPARVLQALQQDGIIALKNIPNYANLRERYLREAAQCAALNADNGDDHFVSRKLFSDGTNRMTISTNAGRELSGSAVATDAACPGYRALYEEFSATVERAVNTFGSALDATSFTASDGQKRISSRQLIGEAVRLDHFHAYEAAKAVDVDGLTAGDATQTRTRHRALAEQSQESVASQESLESALSLPLHEDHGLFIAMSAPKFFEVDASANGQRTRTRQLTMVERALAPDASGLILQKPSTGARVRPVLKADEVVIMMGTGASRWLQTSHALPAVLHGMQMPEAMTRGDVTGRALRAWFGKMTLLPSYQRMLLNNGMAFEEHVNTTTRYLMTKDESDLKTVGCATGRHLAPSASTCTFKECAFKNPSTVQDNNCNYYCNLANHDAEAKKCAEYCTCTTSSAPADVCWMLCVKNLPESECPLSNQECTPGGQKLTCATSSPQPPTPTPSTPTPSTPKPSTPTPKPSTPTPSTPKPNTPSTPSPNQSTPAPEPSEGDPQVTPEPSTETSDAGEGSSDTISPTSAAPTPEETTSSASVTVVSTIVAVFSAIAIACM